MPNQTWDDLRDAVGGVFMNSPGPAIVNGTAAIGGKIQDLYQAASDKVATLTAPKKPARGDIYLPPDKRRKGRSITGSRR